MTRSGTSVVSVAIILSAVLQLVVTDCPCSSAELCKPITNTKRNEIFMFSLHDNKATWTKFNYTKVTTIVMVGYVSLDLMCYAHARNTRVVIIANYPTSNLTNPSARQLWVEKQLSTVRDNYLDGINIDYESAIGMDQKDLERGYTSLVQETYAAFKKTLPYSQVTVDVAWSPTCIDNRCYDYKALSLATDFLFVMSYDEQSQIQGQCVAKANSGYYKTLAGVSGYRELDGIPVSKLVLGLPWYGYLYKCVDFVSQENKCAIKKVPFRGVNCSDAAGTQHDYSAIMKQLGKPGTQLLFDEATMTPCINFQDPNTKEHYQIWYDDPKSLSLKYNMAVKLGLRGVGIWNADSLDYTNDTQINTMWDAFPDYSRD